MVKWRVRSCPRCSGDLFLDRDLDFWYQQCLQCSYRVELKPLSVKEATPTGDRQAKKPAKSARVSGG
jgi:hypothetical protein